MKDKKTLESIVQELQQRVDSLEFLITPFVGKVNMPLQHPAKGLNLYGNEENVESENSEQTTEEVN